MRAKIIKSLEENKSINLCDLRLDNNFSHMIPKTELRETKQNKTSVNQKLALQRKSLRK